MRRHADSNARDALIAAARAEFSRRGLRGARIEDITAACGLSKGAFYLHFSSKEALFGELIEAFAAELGPSTERRHADMERLIAKHGPITRRDVQERSPAYGEMLELETAADLLLLEHMWSYRDVVGVLLSGSRGTAYENVVWDMTDREIERVKETFSRFQANHACRDDIPPEGFGSMVVGTYLLLGARMSRMAEKPDLREWARSLQMLIREGSAPVESAAQQLVLVSAAPGNEAAARMVNG
jgi:AcrR family transcriptional regulator